MTSLMKYNAANLNQFFDLINRNSIGMNDYFDRLTTIPETQSNYPPYNLVQVSGQEFRLELALAGFKKNEINVYTQRANSLSRVTKRAETAKDYLHRGVAARSFTRTWSLTDETEVGSVVFEDGFLEITLQKIIPRTPQKKGLFVNPN